METLRIERSKLITGQFHDGCGNRCALGWLLALRGAKTPIELGDDVSFADQNRSLLSDLPVKLGGEWNANVWALRVIESNNRRVGRDREQHLRRLFRQIEIRVVFVGRSKP